MIVNMMWEDFFKALALVLIIEGLIPFWRPETWRRTIGRIASQPDNALRFMGLASMLIGLMLLYFIRQSL